jgi:hypothetical protein
MDRILRYLLLLLATMTLGSAALFAQRVTGMSPRPTIVSYVGSYGFGGYGGWSGGYGYSSYPRFTPATPYPYRYWWVGPYADNGSQAGYNPSAGYEWDSVGTLLLSTFPAKARVILNGVPVGTADKLGPFQLPVGEHTLRIEAEGYEPSETIVKFDQPGVQELKVQLKRLTASAKPGPRS